MRFFCFCLFTFWHLTVFGVCRVIDDANNIIDVKKPAQRIISLSPDLTENLFAIGAGPQIVGVISGSDYPGAAKKLPQIGSYTGVDLERIVMLQPDLIVVWGHLFAKQINAIRQLLKNVTIYISSPEQLADIPRTLNNLGCLTGKQNQAQQLAQLFQQQIKLIGTQSQHNKKIPVFFQIGSYSLMTINKKSWINQVIELCGGKNIFADMQTISGEVTWEAILKANPKIIFSDAENSHWKVRWQKWKNIDAVKHQYLFAIEPDLIERASPRLLLGIKKVCSRIS